MRMSMGLFFFLLSFSSFGQNPDFKQLSMDILYEKHVYYSFEDGTTASDIGRSWDIGFSVPGKSQAGIFINEFAGRDMRPAIMQGPFPDFLATSPPPIGDTLRNSEVDWYTGAFNESATTDNPYGWGAMANNGTIVGTQSYIIQLPNNLFKKVMIDSLEADGTYTFHHANLDNSDWQSVSFNINDSPNKVMVHYSIENQKFVEIEPEKWDLLFTRVNDLANIGGSEFFPYNVTSVLTKDGYRTVEINNVDPFSIDTTGNLNNFVLDNDIIGHDWKAFDLVNFEWVLNDERVFFVETDDCYWKFFVYDFEGAFTGGITVAQEKYVRQLVSIDSNNAAFEQLSLFPNPVKDHLNVIYTLKQAYPKVRMEITNMLGQVVYWAETTGIAGRNAKSFNHIDLPNGQYALQLYAGSEVVSEKIIVAR